MATNYSTVIKETALRINGIAGAAVATVETNYASTVISTSALDNPRYPPSAITDAVLDAEAMIAHAVATTKDHQWREYMREQSAFVTSGAALPTVGGSSGVYIGTLDPPIVMTGTRELELAEYGDVRAYLNDPTYFATNPNIYALRGGLLFHTLGAGAVKFSGCVFSRSARAAALVANGAILFPDVAVPLYWAGAVSLLTRDGEYAAQSQQYRQYFETGIQMLTAGQTTFQQFVPEPPQVAKASV